jgi:AbrB family looped-hinge helix DNA binding protein
MQMKVFNKGQVVIPAGMRRDLGIAIGDTLDVAVDRDNHAISLRPHRSSGALLAGSLASYARAKQFPSRRRMAEALSRGLAGEA